LLGLLKEMPACAGAQNGLSSSRVKLRSLVYARTLSGREPYSAAGVPP